MRAPGRRHRDPCPARALLPGKGLDSDRHWSPAGGERTELSVGSDVTWSHLHVVRGLIAKGPGLYPSSLEYISGTSPRSWLWEAARLCFCVSRPVAVRARGPLRGSVSGSLCFPSRALSLRVPCPPTPTPRDRPQPAPMALSSLLLASRVPCACSPREAGQGTPCCSAGA